MEINSDLMYRLLVQGVSNYAIYMLDRDGIVLNWNTGAERAKGYAASDIVGRNYELFYSAEDRSAGLPRQNLATALRQGRLSAEGWRYKHDGTTFWASITIDAIYDAENTFLCFAKVTRDLTEQHEWMARIEHQANHDALTGLLNRAGLFKRLSVELAAKRPTAIHCIDLDRFKTVNDRLGHPAGDVVLSEVAKRLTEVLADDGFAGRLGGDEFVAVQTGVADHERVRSLAQRIVSQFGVPIEVQGEAVAVGASIGIAQSPHHGVDVGTLLRKADAALYKAKGKGRNSVAVAEDLDLAGGAARFRTAGSREPALRSLA